MLLECLPVFDTVPLMNTKDNVHIAYCIHEISSKYVWSAKRVKKQVKCICKDLGPLIVQII